MIVTIDRAGRIVVPKRLRERFSLVADTELEMVAAGDCLQLRRVDAEPSLVRKTGRDLQAALGRFAPSPDALDAIDDVVRRRGEPGRIGGSVSY